MGMFAQEYKQPIPQFARTIGIVTAPTGAAIRDIINIAKRRNPYVQLLLCIPCFGAGGRGGAKYCAGIRRLEKRTWTLSLSGAAAVRWRIFGPSMKKIVARAIFDCRVPVISAVGHETDTTIADYVADLRAPTPSAAAELAVFEYATLSNGVEENINKDTLKERSESSLEKIKTGQYALKSGDFIRANNCGTGQQRRWIWRAAGTERWKKIHKKRRFGF